MANNIYTLTPRKIIEAVFVGLTMAVSYWNLNRQLREIKKDTEYIRKWK